MNPGNDKAATHPVVALPPSKSLTHRALVAAALADGASTVRRPLICEDTLYTMEGLRRLGVSLDAAEREVVVQGRGGRLAPGAGTTPLYLGNAGTTFRFLVALAALRPGHHHLTGTPRMCERPVEDLACSLSHLGAKVAFVQSPGFPPVDVTGRGLHGGKVRIPGGKSSQFVSALLLAAPCASGEVKIEVAGDLVSRQYVDLTLAVMARFGVEVERKGYCRFRVPAPQSYGLTEFTVEGDASSASYFWAAAAVTGGAVTTTHLDPFRTLQGDIRFLAILEEMGCEVERERDCVTVRGKPLRAVDADMSAMPDLVPTLAATALFAEGKTTICNVSHLRIKENDRLAVVAAEWMRLGARVEETQDGLTIWGNQPLRSARAFAHADHRIAMSLAVAGLRVPGLEIEEADCVAKSFPGFWEAWRPVKEALTGMSG